MVMSGGAAVIRLRGASNEPPRGVSEHHVQVSERAECRRRLWLRPLLTSSDDWETLGDRVKSARGSLVTSMAVLPRPFNEQLLRGEPMQQV